MTNRDRKRGGRPRSGGYREPAPAAPPARKGFLDNLLAPRSAAATSMPRIRTSLLRGAVTVLATPALVIGPIVYTFVGWLVLVAGGYQGSFAPLANGLALPPIGTSLDATLATGVFGLKGGILGLFLFLAVRAVALALLTAIVVTALDGEPVTASTLRRGVRALPVAFATCIIGVGVLYFGGYLAPLLGPGFGILIQVGVVIFGVYLFAFAPIVAVDERRAMPDALARSFRAARMPGAGNLSLAALYTLPSLVVILIRAVPGSTIGANPSIGAWVYVLGVNLLHVAVLATYAFRYLSVEHEVPEAPVRASRGSRAPAGRGRR